MCLFAYEDVMIEEIENINGTKVFSTIFSEFSYIFCDLLILNKLPENNVRNSIMHTIFYRVRGVIINKNRNELW